MLEVRKHVVCVWRAQCKLSVYDCWWAVSGRRRTHYKPNAKPFLSEASSFENSSVHARFSWIDTVLGISMRCAAHELSYINATGSQLTSINIVSLCISFWGFQKSMPLIASRLVLSSKTLTGRGVLKHTRLALDFREGANRFRSMYVCLKTMCFIIKMKHTYIDTRTN